MGHMLAAVAENCRVTFVGVALVKGTPAAFVEIHPKDLAGGADDQHDTDKRPSPRFATTLHDTPHHEAEDNRPRDASPSNLRSHRIFTPQLAHPTSSIRGHWKRAKIFSAGIAHNAIYCVIIYCLLANRFWEGVLWEKRPEVQVSHIDPDSPLSEYFPHRNLRRDPLILQSMTDQTPIRFVSDVEAHIESVVHEKYCIPPAEFMSLTRNGQGCLPTEFAVPMSSPTAENPTKHREMVSLQRYQPFYPAESTRNNRVCISAQDLVRRRRCSTEPCPNFEYCTELTHPNLRLFTMRFKDDPREFVLRSTVENFFTHVLMTDVYSKVPFVSIEALANFRHFLRVSVFFNAMLALSNVQPWPHLDGDKFYLEIVQAVSARYRWSGAMRVYKCLQKIAIVVGAFGLVRTLIMWMREFWAQ